MVYKTYFVLFCSAVLSITVVVREIVRTEGEVTEVRGVIASEIRENTRDYLESKRTRPRPERTVSQKSPKAPSSPSSPSKDELSRSRPPRLSSLESTLNRPTSFGHPYPTVVVDDPVPPSGPVDGPGQPLTAVKMDQLNQRLHSIDETPSAEFRVKLLAAFRSEIENESASVGGNEYYDWILEEIDALTTESLAAAQEERDVSSEPPK